MARVASTHQRDAPGDLEIIPVLQVYSVKLRPEMRATVDAIAASEQTSTGAVVRRLILAGLRAEGHDVPTDEATR